MKTTTVNGLRPCARCGERFPATTEYFHRTRGDRLIAYCKPCARGRAMEHYRANYEKALAARAVYRDLHRAELRAYFLARHYRLNPERPIRLTPEERRAKKHGYYRAHLAEHKARMTRWRALNPDKARVQVSVANHRRRGAKPTREGRAFIMILRRDPCAYCGDPVTKIEIDHIVPVSDGGSGDWTNLTAACRPCNLAKGRKSLLAFLISRRSS